MGGNPAAILNVRYIHVTFCTLRNFCTKGTCYLCRQHEQENPAGSRILEARCPYGARAVVFNRAKEPKE